MNQEVSVTLTRQTKYQFTVDFGGTLAPMLADEPAPLGDDAGPSPTQLLATAVGCCMSSSLLFASGRSKEDAGAVKTTVTCAIGRNERNRLRVLAMKVDMTLGVEPQTLPHLDQVLAQFEDFCTVSQSVQTGIPMSVTVRSPDGRILK